MKKKKKMGKKKKKMGGGGNWKKNKKKIGEKKKKLEKKVPYMVVNTEKRKNCLLQAISPFLAMFSAICFNLDQSKILSSGNRLKLQKRRKSTLLRLRLTARRLCQ